MSYTEGYNAISRVYDKLNAEVDYSAWADFVESCFDRYLSSRPELVLDLACGTGSMTMELARRGYDMIGVDGSEEMLSEAYGRSAEVGGILYLMQDMRSFELYGTVGAVTCCLDSLNYLTGEGDLLRCFKNVHNYLDPDGLFIFDMNTPHKFENVYADNSYIFDDVVDGVEVYCGWQNYYDRESKICSFYLSVFEEGENGEYYRADEEQKERFYSNEEITSALEKTGFELLDIFSDVDFSKPLENSERLYFVARAKK